MKKSKIHPFKQVIFMFIPLITLLLIGEIACRVKFFLYHDKDWNYITMPFRVGENIELEADRAFYMPPEQMVIKWHKPAKNRKVYSDYHGKMMDYTYDKYCFRGDRVELEKNPNEYRIFVLGGSTVEDFHSDEEMMTNQIKLALPKTHYGKDIKVVNSGRKGYSSSTFISIYKKKTRRFKPDLVLYYEAWNEQDQDRRFVNIMRAIGNINKSKFFNFLHYRSMLYTYLVEKYSFIRTKHRVYIIDLPKLEKNLLTLRDEVLKSGADFVFITQAVKIPRHFKKIDTFNYKNILTLLNSLKNNPDYLYDPFEISALNQRLAVFYSIEICKKYSIPYINILDEIEVLNNTERDELFWDLGHKTSKGNRAIGKLIGSKLVKLLKDKNEIY